MSDRVDRKLAGPLPPTPLSPWLALLDQSRELHVATNSGTGAIVWANAAFHALAGPAARLPGATLDLLALPDEAGSATRRLFHAARARAAAGEASRAEHVLCRSSRGDPLRVGLQVRCVDELALWTLTDTTREHRLEAEAARQRELLDMAQEFGRIGIWERDIASGRGRWDRHVFGFWGLDPEAGTPPYARAIERIHPQDRVRMTFESSTHQAGRYAQHYRVIHPDGTTRWIHSQWAIVNGTDGTPERAIGIMMDDTEAYADARALIDANAQLKLAVELGRIAIWRHDLVTQRMYYSDLAFELLGMPRRNEGLTLEEVRSLIHPDDIPLVVASAERALKSDEPADMEARYRRADGSWRDVLTRRVVERDAAGQPLAFVGVALDVSERVEQRRQADEAARRLAAASLATGIGIWTTTLEPLEADWNAQMFALFDAFDPPRTPTLHEWLERSVHPAERERVSQRLRTYMKVGDGPFEVEFQAVRRDGSLRWIVLRADIDQLRDDRRRILGVAIDVTEQREALAALQTASERAALITRYAGIGTWESWPDGTEIWDEQMFQLRGLPPGGTPPDREQRLALLHPDDRAIPLDARPGAVGDGPTAAYEFRVRLGDGSYRWLASRSALVLDGNGRLLRRVGVNWDATLSKDTEFARQQAAIAEREMQARSQFLSRMSHELRTPLNAVLGFTQLLQAEARRDEQSAQLAKLGHIRSAGDHLLSLINDVLDLTSIESGEIRLATQAVDLDAFTEETLPLLESLAARHGVAIRLEPGGGIAEADPTRLRQVLINLLSNAIKYNRRGGEVVVRTFNEDGDDGRALLLVRDTGRGLSEEQVASLFEPFNRFGVEGEGIEGTGIGLTIVKSLVEGMGGTIDVTSRRGVGSTFRVALKASTGPTGWMDLPPPPVPAPVEASVGERSGRILYIEDNQVNVILVEELIRNVAGLSVEAEATGMAGVARARETLPDLVLIDLTLPDIDGYDVLRRLRIDPATRTIPCIALSANAMPEDIERGLGAGFADYWTKPIEFGAFVAALQKLFPARPAATAAER